MNLPSNAIASEILGLDYIQKSVLLNELADSILESQEGSKSLNLSADATQWCRAATVAELLAIIQAIAYSLREELLHSEKLSIATKEISFCQYRADQGHEFCPCGDLFVYQCSGSCDEIQDILDPNWMYNAVDEGLEVSQPAQPAQPAK